jgi:glucose/arabinose dehydrogenase
VLLSLLLAGCAAAPPSELASNSPPPTTASADPASPAQHGQPGPTLPGSGPSATPTTELADSGEGPLPAHFRESIVISNLSAPTAFDFASDGRIFIAEKRGLIKEFDGLDDEQPEVLADLRTNVYNGADRGLLGMAIDPHFPARPYLYVTYSLDGGMGNPVPQWGGDGDHDRCVDYGGWCVGGGRLSRIAADGSETVLVEDWCEAYVYHSMGDVNFGPDGALYAGGGDGAHPTVDYGGVGDPPNACGDPPSAAGTALEMPTSEGGSLRAQDLFTTGDPVGLSGSIIRVDPDTGAAVADNPRATADDDNERRIVAYGLRNPFRFTFRPATTELWIGDVGGNLAEELDVVDQPAGGTVPNFGWPCFEGAEPHPAWREMGSDLCQRLQSSGQAGGPRWSYNRPSAVSPADRCVAGNSAISGLAFYDGELFPTEYRGALFIADYARSCIWVMRAGPDGMPDPATVTSFHSAAVTPVDLHIGPDGALYYVDIWSGTLRRISYYADDEPPLASISADRLTGELPLEVRFDGGASSAAGGGPLTFAWDLDGDGEFDDSAEVSPSWVYERRGEVIARLRVTTASGDDTAVVRLRPGEALPQAVITSPANGLRWQAGQQIAFAGQATDAEDGQLPDRLYRWTLLLHHCPDSCHVHELMSLQGVVRGSFEAPDHEYPAHLELRLTVTDRSRLSVSTSVTLEPLTSTLELRSEPAGLTLVAGDVAGSGPLVLEVVRGSQTPITAPAVQLSGGICYALVGWSDGGAPTHPLEIDDARQSVTASYEPLAGSARCT